MKKVLILLSVVVLFMACNEDNVPTINPPEQATVSGATVNVCPDYTIVLTATAAYATSFQWVKNGVLLDGKTGSTLVATEAGTYRVFGVNEHGQGSLSVEKTISFVRCAPPKAVISGSPVNICPEHSVTLTVTARGATLFQWKKNGEVIQLDTITTLTVFESGVFSVSGINEIGEGEFSDNFEVIISECVPLIDLLAGIWDATGVIWFENRVVTNNHSLLIEKTSETTIRIINFDGSGSQNIIVATVDNEARTIHIPEQQSFFSFDWFSGTVIYSQAGGRGLMPCNHVDAIGTLQVQGIGLNLTIEFPQLHESGDQWSGPFGVTYHILTIDQNGNCTGIRAWGGDTVWRKRR